VNELRFQTSFTCSDHGSCPAIAPGACRVQVVLLGFLWKLA
jgi:hypothetical protein